MKQEMKSVLKKSAKIAGVTCLAAGTIAVLTSGIAIKAIGEGGKYLVNTVKRIIQEKEVTAEAVPEQGDTLENTRLPQECPTLEIN